MFQYLNLPAPDADPVLETPDVTTSAPPTYPSQTQQDTAHSTQPLHFPVPSLAISLVQPEHPSSSQRFETNEHHQSVSALLQHAQAQQVHAHTATHDQPCNSLAQSRPFTQLQGQSHMSQLPLSQSSSHALPIPLPLPHPHTQQHLQPPLHNLSPWQPQPMPLGASLPPSQSQHTPSRHLPVGDLLYNAPSLIPSNDIPHLPPVSDPSLSRERGVQSGKRHDSMRRRQPAAPTDIPHRSPRKRQKRSLVWNFFQESKTNPNVALCLICHLSIPRGRNLARNTTNLRKHLEHRHPTELAEHALKGKRAAALQSLGPPHESPAQSQNTNNQLNFPPIAPSSEPLHSSMHQACQLPNGHQPALGNDRHTLAVSLSAATACNGLTHYGNNERSIRRSLEESSAVMQCGTERMSSGSNINFSDQMAFPVQYRLNSAVTERTQFLDPPEVDGQSRGHEPARSSMNPSRSATWPRNGEERQNGVVPGNPIPMGPLEMSSGMLDFLAIMDLPLAASKSKGFEALFSAARLQGHLPNIFRLRTGMLVAQKRALRAKIKILLAEAEKLAIVVENTNTCRIILCRYFRRSLDFGYLCLEVVPCGDPSPEHGNETKASVSDVYPSASSRPENRALTSTKQMRQLSGHIDKVLEVWDIREKVTAIVTSEVFLPADKTQFLFRKTSRKNQSASGRDDSDSSRSSRQTPIYNEMNKEKENLYNGTAELNCSPCNRIPMVSCLVSVVQRIVSDTICEDETVERLFIEPMSRGLFKALADRSFILSEDLQSRPLNLKLPLTNLSMEDMLPLLEYFIHHFDMVQAVLNKQGGAIDMDIVCMQKGDLKFLHMLLSAFSDSLFLIRDVKQKGVVFRSEHISIALPAMKQLLQKVETIYQEVGEPLKKVTMNVLRSLKLQYDAMESQEVYTCATLLDPRFKGQYFTSKDVADMAEASVTDAYESERRRNEEKRHNKESAGNLQNILEVPPSDLDHYMDSMIADRTVLSTSLSSYMAEPTLEYTEDIEAYWREHQQKWPVLCEIATQYSLIPSACETDRVHSVLGDYRNVHSVGESQPSDALALTFLKNNLLLVDGSSIFSQQ